MVTRRQVFGAAAAIAAARVVPRPVAGAQDATPVVDETILARFPLQLLPGPPDPGVEAWFLGYLVEPGGSQSITTDMGPTLMYVATGTITLSVEGTLAVHRADGSEETVEAAAGEPADVALAAGDAALSMKGNRVGGRNDSDADADVLQFLVFSPMDEETGSEEGVQTGMRPRLIAVGRGTLPEEPGVIMLRRIRHAPGATGARESMPVIEVGGVEAGTMTADITAGEALRWPQMMTFDLSAANADTDAATPSPRERIGAGDSVTLTEGDGYALADDVTLTWIAGDAGVTLIQAVIGVER